MADIEIDIETTTISEEPPVDEAPAQTPDAEPSPAPASPAPAEQRGGFWWGTGRRKAAVARVRLRPGKGTLLINGKKVDQYFTELRDRKDVTSPLTVTSTDEKLDVYVNVNGGGFMGQAGAVKLGISRALKAYDPTVEPVLRQHDMLTRDARRVERKKPGQPGARKRFQFSKR